MSLFILLMVSRGAFGAGGLLFFSQNGSPYVTAVQYETFSQPSAHLAYITTKGGKRTQIPTAGIAGQIPFPDAANPVSSVDAASYAGQASMLAARYPQYAKLLQATGELWTRYAEKRKTEEERLAKLEQDRIRKEIDEKRTAQLEQERLAKIAEEQRLAKVAEEQRLAQIEQKRNVKQTDSQRSSKETEVRNAGVSEEKGVAESPQPLGNPDPKELHVKSMGDMMFVEGGIPPKSWHLRTAEIPHFFISKCETTWGDWNDISEWASSQGYQFSESPNGSADDHPVFFVTVEDVLKWCNAKSEKDGLVPAYTVDGQIFKSGSSGNRKYEFNERANGYRLPTEE